MSKQNAAKNKQQEPGETVVGRIETQPVTVSRVYVRDKNAITPEELDEVLAILPMSKIHLASLLRYGDDPWTPIEKARAKLEELKARFAG